VTVLDPFVGAAGFFRRSNAMNKFIKLIEAMTMFLFVLAVFLAIVGVLYR
jgi:hypothetical protein